MIAGEGHNMHFLRLRERFSSFAQLQKNVRLKEKAVGRKDNFEEKLYIISEKKHFGITEKFRKRANKRNK